MTALEQLVINASSTTTKSASNASNTATKVRHDATSKSLTLAALHNNNNNNNTNSRLVEATANFSKASNNSNINNNTSASIANLELKENCQSTQSKSNVAAVNATPPLTPQSPLKLARPFDMIIEKNESIGNSDETNETSSHASKTNDVVIVVEKRGICVRKATLDGQISIDINSNLVGNKTDDSDVAAELVQVKVETVNDEDLTNNNRWLLTQNESNYSKVTSSGT